MASEFLGKILFLFAGAVFISWPVVANVYAWKYSKPSGIAVSTLTAATFICFIIGNVLPHDDDKIIVAAISTLCILIAVLGILSFPVLANVYAWKVDKTAGEVVSSLTGGAFLAMIIAQGLNGRFVTEKLDTAVKDVSNVVKDVGNAAYGAAGGRRLKTNYRHSSSK